MRHLRKLAIVGAAAFFLTACTSTHSYNPTYFTDPMVTGTKDGSGSVLLSSSDANTPSKANPASFTGGATSVSVPLNLIVAEAAVKAFDRALQGSVARVEQPTPGSGYLITPALASFSYKYDQLSNLGFAVTPKVTMQVRVRVTDPSGAVVLEKTYARQDVSGGTYVASLKPAERINRAFHEAALSIMAEAANDFVSSTPNTVRVSVVSGSTAPA